MIDLKKFPIKVKYEFIHFVQIGQTPKTSIWDCCNTRSDRTLGQIRWYPQWRQYTFMVEQDSVYSVGCLRDVIEFIEQLKAYKL